MCTALAFAHHKGIAHRDLKPENVLLFKCEREHSRGSGMSLPHTSSIASMGSQTGNVGSPVRGHELKNALHGWISERDETAADVIRSSFVARVCDFGSSFVTPSADVASGKHMVGHSACGSTKYSSPQVRRLMCLRMDSKNAEATWSKASWSGLRSEGYDPFLGDVWSLGVLLYVGTVGSRPWRYACVFDSDWRGFVAHTQPHVLSDSVCAPGSVLWRESSPAWKWPSRMSPALRHLLQGCLAVRQEERFSMQQVVDHPWFENPLWKPSAAVVSVVASAGGRSVTSDGSDSRTFVTSSTAGGFVAAKSLLPAIGLSTGAAGASVVTTQQAGVALTHAALSTGSPLRVSTLPPPHASLPSGASSGSRFSSAHSTASPASHRSLRSAAGDNRSPTTDAFGGESPAVSSLRMAHSPAADANPHATGSTVHSMRLHGSLQLRPDSSGERSAAGSSARPSSLSFQSSAGGEPSPTSATQSGALSSGHMHSRILLLGSAAQNAAAAAVSGSLSAGGASRGIAARTAAGSLQSRTQSSHVLKRTTPGGGSPAGGD